MICFIKIRSIENKTNSKYAITYIVAGYWQ